MGFPASYPDMDPPGPFLLPVFVFLASLRSFLSLALDLLGLGDLVSDDLAFPTTTTSWSDQILVQHHPEADAEAVRLTRCCRRLPAPAALVRELLPATTYANDDEGDRDPGHEAPHSETGCCGNTCFCTVCLCELRRGDEVRRPLGCSHVFHRWCLDPWLDLGRRTCPLCRVPLVDGCKVGKAGAVADRDLLYDYSIDDDGAGLDGFGSYSLGDPYDMASSLSMFLLTPPNHGAAASA